MNKSFAINRIRLTGTARLGGFATLVAIASTESTATAACIDVRPQDPATCVCATIDACCSERWDEFCELALYYALGCSGASLPAPILLPAAELCDGDGQDPIVPGVGHPYLVDESRIIDATTFGAVPDDGVDDTFALQQAIDALTWSPSGGVLLVPAGAYDLTGTLVIDSDAPIHVLGAGAHAGTRGTSFVWSGPPDVPALRLVGLRDSWFERFGIYVGPNARLRTAIQIEGKPGRRTTRLTFRGTVASAVVDQLDTGIRIVAGRTATAGIDNDRHYFEGLLVTNYRRAAVAIEHPKSLGHLFVNTGAVCAPPVSGESAGVGVSTLPHGSSFTFLGGGGGTCSAGFDLGPANGPITIEGFNTEWNDRLLRTTQSAGPAWPVRVMTARFDRNTQSEAPALEYHLPGPLILDGNLFATQNAVPIAALPLAGSDIVMTNNLFHSLATNVRVAAPVQKDVGVGLSQHGNIRSTTVTVERTGVYQVDALPNQARESGEVAFDARLVGPRYRHVVRPRVREAELQMPGLVDIRRFFRPNAPDIATRNTMALQEAVNTLEGRGGIVFIPDGRFPLNDTVLIRPTAPVRIRGAASETTVLEWRGASDRAMFRFVGVRNSSLAHLTILASQPLHAGVVFETAGLDYVGRAATAMEVHDVVVDGGPSAALAAGFRIVPGRYAKPNWPAGDLRWGGCFLVGAGSASYDRPYAAPSENGGDECLRDWNNDFNFFSFTAVRRYQDAGWSIEHPQSVSNLFLHSRFEAARDRRPRAWSAIQAGVTTRRGLGPGSYLWVGGGGGENGGADFTPGSVWTIVRDAVLTGSRSLIVDGVRSGAFPVVLTRNEWRAADDADKLVNITEIHGTNGPLVLRGNRFDAPPSVGAVVYQWSMMEGAVSGYGNDFAWIGSETNGGFDVATTPRNTVASGRTDLTFRANRFRDFEGKAVVRDKR